jgi:VanZ family protein
MSGRARFRSAWLPVVGWLLVIFTLSSIPDLGTREQRFPWSDKLAHLCEYGVLGILFARARSERVGWARAAGWGGLLGLMIGIADEWYQTLTPGRSSGPGDVAADMVGAALGGIVWHHHLLQRIHRAAHRCRAAMIGRRST